MTRLAIAIGIFGLAVPAHAAAPGLDVLHYDVRLDVPLGEAITQGVETIRLRLPADGRGEAVFDAAGLMVESVREGARPLLFEHEGERLTVRWKQPPPPGNVRTIEVRYRFHSGRGLRTTADQAFTVFTTWGWMVCRSDPGDRATATLHLTAPSGLRLVATGQPGRVRSRADGRVEQSAPRGQQALVGHPPDEAIAIERDRDDVTFALGGANLNFGSVRL